MANVITGLAGLRAKQQEHAEKEAARNRPKAEYFKWDDNKKAPNPDVVLVQFIQEIDSSARGYDEAKGLAVAAVEHEAPGPKGYLARALCTMESEGQCYACERKRADYQEGWKTKTNLYINALVDYGAKGEPEVRVISRNFNQAFAQALIDEAVDNGSITDTVFKITRYGSGTQTVWNLVPTKQEVWDASEAESFDIRETVLRDVSYEKQPEYFGRVWDGPEDQAAVPSVDTLISGGSESVEW